MRWKEKRERERKIILIFRVFHQQITAIEDIDLAIAQLESTNWNLEVSCKALARKIKINLTMIFFLSIQQAVHLALEETSPQFSNDDVNMLDAVSSEPARDFHNEAGKKI